MSQPSINVTLHTDGTVTVAVDGMKGHKCKEFSKPFEDALGLEDKNDKPTPEMYQKETTKQNVKA